jgi:hypothetical protein
MPSFNPSSFSRESSSSIKHTSLLAPSFSWFPTTSLDTNDNDDQMDLSSSVPSSSPMIFASSPIKLSEGDDLCQTEYSSPPSSPRPDKCTQSSTLTDFEATIQCHESNREPTHKFDSSAQNDVNHNRLPAYMPQSHFDSVPQQLPPLHFARAPMSLPLDVDLPPSSPPPSSSPIKSLPSSQDSHASSSLSDLQPAHESADPDLDISPPPLVVTNFDEGSSFEDVITTTGPTQGDEPKVSVMIKFTLTLTSFIATAGLLQRGEQE